MQPFGNDYFNDAYNFETLQNKIYSYYEKNIIHLVASKRELISNKTLILYCLKCLFDYQIYLNAFALCDPQEPFKVFKLYDMSLK